MKDTNLWGMMARKIYKYNITGGLNWLSDDSETDKKGKARLSKMFNPVRKCYPLTPVYSDTLCHFCTSLG